MLLLNGTYFGNDKVVEGVGLGQNEVLLNVHELIGRNSPQFRKVRPQILEGLLQELVNRVSLLHPQVATVTWKYWRLQF